MGDGKEAEKQPLLNNDNVNYSSGGEVSGKNCDNFFYNPMWLHIYRRNFLEFKKRLSL